MIAPMNRSAAAIHTLSKADPQFAAFVRTLYGSNVDADAVWEDVYGVSKLAPDQADLNTPGTPDPSFNRRRKVAIAGVLAGTALGAQKVVQDVPKVTQALRAGKGLLVPTEGAPGRIAQAANKVGIKSLPDKAVGGLAVGATALGADANELEVLANRKLQQRNGVASKRQPSIKEMVDGRHKVNRMLCPTDHPALKGAFPKDKKVKKAAGDEFNPRWQPGTPQPPGAAKPTAPKGVNEDWAKAGQSAVNGAKKLVGTKGGRLALGGLAAYEAKNVYDRRQERKYDPYAGYGKRAPSVEWQGEFAKFDDDKQLAFGWASVVKLNGQPVVDRQGDLIEMDDIEKAAYDYVQRSRVGGGMHERTSDDQAIHLSDLVESFVVTDEKVEKMGLPPETPRGWWVGFKVNDDDAWGKVKKGEWTGFSIHGRGKRIEKSLDEVMGY